MTELRARYEMLNVAWKAEIHRLLRAKQGEGVVA
jgi:hypothetical protein